MMSQYNISTSASNVFIKNLWQSSSVPLGSWCPTFNPIYHLSICAFDMMVASFIYKLVTSVPLTFLRKISLNFPHDSS
jgi:hypothetical protein